MGKLRTATCFICGKRIGSHDANRASVRVAKGSAGQGVRKSCHLSCYQNREQQSKVL